MLKSSFDITGNADAEEVRQEIIKERRNGLTPVPGEIPKTTEQLEVLEMVNARIDKECEALGVVSGDRLLPQQVHILPQRMYAAKFGSAPAVSVIEEHAVYVREGPYSREQFAHLMMHEALHPRGFQRYYGNAATDTWLNSRTGSAIITPRQKAVNNFRTEPLRYFGSLNESVVEALALELLQQEGHAAAVDNYGEDRKLLQDILRIIARKNGVEIMDVWRTFKRSNFTGELMHLRELERALEPGALRLYAHVDAGNSKMIAGMREYLTATDPSEKERLAGLILSGHLPANRGEVEKYKRRLQPDAGTPRA